ncbi:MAG: GAF domain-containing protein [Kofleriaceae bacterium]
MTPRIEIDAKPAGPPWEREFALRHTARLIEILQELSTVPNSGSVLEIVRQAAQELTDTDGVTAIDATGRMVYANDAAAAFCGYADPESLQRAPRAEVFGKFELFRTTGERFPLEELPTRLAFEGKRAPEGALIRWRSRETGIDRWSILNAVPIFSTDGSIQLVFSIFHDVTQRIRREHRERLVARVTALFNESLDEAATLPRFVDVLRSELTDWCVLYVAESDELQQFASHPQLTEQLTAQCRTLLQLPRPVAEVLATSSPVLVSDASPELLLCDDDHRDPQAVSLLQRLGVNSFMVVPLRGRSTTVGAVLLACNEGNHRHDEVDLATAQDVANRAAAYVDNTRLFREANIARDAAQAYAARADLLAEASRAFAAAGVDVERLLETVVRRVAEVVGDSCSVRTLCPEGTMSIHRASWHRHGIDLDDAQRALMTAPRPAGRGYFGQVIRTGKPVIIRDVHRSEIAQEYRGTEIHDYIEQIGPRTAAIFPLRAGTRTFGALAASRSTGRAYDADELRLLEELSDRAALALENARLYADVEQARRDAEQAAARIAKLQALTAALAASTTQQQVIDAAMNHALEHLEAAASVLYVFDDGAFQLVAHHGFVPSDRVRVLSLDAKLPLADAIREQRPLWIEDHASLVAAYPAVSSVASVASSVADAANAAAPIPADRLQSTIALPLLVHGVSVGGLALSFGVEKAFSLVERDALLAMASQIAQALERARLVRTKEATHARLQENEARYRYIFESAAVGIAEKDYRAVKQRLDAVVAGGVTDLRGYLNDHPELVDEAVGLVKVCDVNEAMVELLEADQRSDLFSLRPIFIPQSRARFIEELVALMDGARVTSGEQQLQTLRGRRIDVLATMAFPPSGCDRVLISRTDITEHKQTLAEREQLVERLKTTVRLNEMFAAILGHDLRNPLGAILTGAQLVLRRASDDQIRRPISRVLSSGERMARMIDQLLDFTRARSGGGIALDRRQFELLRVCKQIVGELEDTNPERAIRLEVVGSTHGWWDPDRLGQVVSNIAGNACQHGAPGTPVHVQIDGTHHDRVVLRVTNAGEIPESVVPVLFEPFRGSHEHREHVSGLGLGLFITQQIILAHGGAIAVSSSGGETTFVAELPRGEPST